MKLKRLPGRHSDERFVKRFGRYLLAEHVLEYLDFKSFRFWLQKYDFPPSPNENLRMLWQEFRVFNAVMLAESSACNLLDQLRGTGGVKDTSKLITSVLQSIKRHQGMKNVEDAKHWMQRTYLRHKKISPGRIREMEDAMFNPYVLLDVGGFSINDLASAFDQHVRQGFLIPGLTRDLRQLAGHRNHLMHGLLSTRRNYCKLITEGPRVGARVLASMKLNAEHFRLKDGDRWRHTRSCPLCSAQS